MEKPWNVWNVLEPPAWGVGAPDRSTMEAQAVGALSQG